MPLTCFPSVSIVIHKYLELVCILSVYYCSIVNEMLVLPLCHVFVVRSISVKGNLVEEIVAEVPCSAAIWLHGVSRISSAVLT